MQTPSVTGDTSESAASVPETWREGWVSEKSKVAIRLSHGDAGGSYAEAAILLCAAFSALSAELWPATSGIDQFRFVEMLVRFGPHASACKLISIPLLVQHLDANSRGPEARLMERAFSLSRMAVVVTGPDVDKSEDEVLFLFPQFKLEELRAFSYASILYKDIRSSYAHQYRPGTRADSWSMTMSNDLAVSYVNQIPDGLQMQRVIHFHIDWLAQLAVEVAVVVDGRAAELPLPRPAKWWTQGG